MRNSDNLQYNYVVFNSYDNKHRIDEDGYYYICTKDLENSSSVKVVTFPLDTKPRWIKILFDIHNSEIIDKYIHLPLKRLWYPFYFENRFDNPKPLCFVIINRSLPIDYFKYLKIKYPNCKIVLMHRDLVKVCQECNRELAFNPIFDMEMTFDKGEAAQYGLPHFNEFESAIDVIKEKDMESDVFFAGKAKDRLPMLLEAYHIFVDFGLKCKFYLTDVPYEKRVKLSGIEYADSFMSYKEMLYHTVNTRCILEINQGSCDGYTSRFLEAVIYGKRLITNNTSIKESKFCTPDKIMVVENILDIKPTFVTCGPDFIDYHYNDEFSPCHMIERVEEELINKFGK